MSLHGDGGSRIFNIDGLDRKVKTDATDNPEETTEKDAIRDLDLTEKFNVVLTNPPFSKKYERSNAGDAWVLDQYVMASGKASLLATLMFFERYHHYLKPGGRLVSVIDDGFLNGNRYRWFRDMLRKLYIVKAVVSLPGDCPLNVCRTIQEGASPMKHPTEEADAELRSAYAFFNAELFAGRLPACLITYPRNRRTYGYFCGDRWDGSGERLADEIALNPQHFTARGTTDVLSTLVHEMVHLEQHHFGKASRTGYHNKQWAEWMDRVGLVPSHNGQPGGKRVGQQMTHYIDAGGGFETACERLLGQDFQISWVDRAEDEPERKPRTTRTKYTCKGCGLNVWAKPDASIRCGDCDRPLHAAA